MIKDADEQSEVGHPGLKKLKRSGKFFFDADEQSEVGHPGLKKLKRSGKFFLMPTNKVKSAIRV